MGVEWGPEIQASVQEDTQVWRGVRELRRTWAVTLPPPKSSTRYPPTFGAQEYSIVSSQAPYWGDSAPYLPVPEL